MAIVSAIMFAIIAVANNSSIYNLNFSFILNTMYLLHIKTLMLAAKKPTAAPAIVSSGQCAPTAIREIHTKIAANKSNVILANFILPVALASNSIMGAKIANTVAECPEGKLVKLAKTIPIILKLSGAKTNVGLGMANNHLLQKVNPPAITSDKITLFSIK